MPSDFFKKSENLVKSIADTRLEKQGIVLVFVLSGLSSNRERQKYRLKNIISRLCNKYPGVSYDKTIDKIFYCEFDDWFTKFGDTNDFKTLTVRSFDGESVDLDKYNPLQNEELLKLIKKLSSIGLAKNMNKTKIGE
jgi:hypothetical protein